MEKEYETEVVEGIVGEQTLDLARQALHKEKRKLLISKICSIVVPIFVAFIIFGTPVILHHVNAEKRVYWKKMIVQVQIDYDDLEKTNLTSIEELNKEKKAEFYWLDNMTRTESYLLTSDGKTVLIEEHYNYNGIECTLYIANPSSSISKITDLKNLDSEFLLVDSSKIKYAIINEKCLAKFEKNHDYYIEIVTTNTSTIESIFSNLTND